ncbi:hypothetical protein WUBG_05524 [Wuchereria bancrofti]|uniref:TMC domain-containing protein n=1 Tax=Wuchereria bancrofti TaxID=6293 RepID=J9EM84_WUCBA|nr:hypothetical protein WUBG_05524 [Wuchereria bancrofti]
MVWLGLFFAPLLPALNNLKLIVLMYIRGWACMTCNVPAREIFRASRSSNFYLMVLLLWLLLCTLPVGYVIASKKPSSTCGPFAGYARFYYVLTQMLEGRLDRKVINWLRYIASPGVVIPVLLLLMLIIYFLVSLVRGLRKTNNDLQQQLIHERTEEKKKIFELAGTAQRKVSQKRQKKKQMVTYLPLVEQKRREPWRYYNGQEYDSSLCVTDEISAITTPNSGQSVSPKHLKIGQLLPKPTIQHESVEILEPMQQQITYYFFSFKSRVTFFQTKKNMNEESGNESEIESKELFPPSNGNTTDWFQHIGDNKDNGDDYGDNDNNDDESSEVQSYNVESDVVEEATSEEVRNLMRRLTKSMRGSAVSLVISPKNDSSGTVINPITVLFPTLSIRRGDSRSALSHYHLSNLSPYDKFSNSSSFGNLHWLADSLLFNKPSQHESKMSKAMQSSSAQSYGSSMHHQSSGASEIHIPTSQLHFAPTISKDENITKQTIFNAKPQTSEIVDTQTKKPKISHSTNRLR